ncbi:HAMP domain-containing protein [Streptomyces sp. NPDC006475]|uniref:HAMP domain-containing protein n=1 Tax=Streptomyces sp. NPDC006475 TaxID=3155719 RepID=UPI0033BC9B07
MTDSDLSVARGERDSVLHDAQAQDGTAMRVATSRPSLPSGVRGAYAVSIAQPVGVVEEPLSTLTIVLLCVAGVGVFGAAAAGLGVARAGLRPVERLTATAEHVALTDDLNVQIPVLGDDEIARLSRSFNAMTGALVLSRDRQQQLIADAGHELRTPLTSLRTNIELLIRSEASVRALPATAKTDYWHP